MFAMSESQLSLHTKCIYKTNTLKHKISKTFEYNISRRVDGVASLLWHPSAPKHSSEAKKLSYTVPGESKKVCNY